MLKTLFYISLAALSLGQFSAVYKSDGSNIYLFDLLIIAFSFFGLIYFLSVRKFRVPLHLSPLGIFTLIAVFSLAVKTVTLPNEEFIYALFFLVRWVSYFLSALIVFNTIDQGLMKEVEFLKAFIISAVFVSLSGFVQLIVLPDFTVLDPALGWDPHKNRLASTFFDPNFTGGYLVLCLVLFIRYISRFRVRATRTILASSAILLIAVFLTFSRSSWAMLAVVILIYGIFKYRWLLALSLILAFSAYFFVPRVQTRIAGATDPADSAQFRLISWQNTWKVAEDNLAFGVGFNAFRNAQKEYGILNPDNENTHSASGSDSGLLLILATTGIAGLAAFFLTFVFTRNLTSAALVGGLLVHSQFVNSVFFPQIMFLWLTAFAVLNYPSRTLR